MAQKPLVTVTYVGGPTVIFEIAGLRIITDPTLDPAGDVYHSGVLVHEKIKGPAIEDIGKIDLVLLSHDQHFDNLDNAGRVLLEKVPKTYTTKIATTRLKGNCVGLDPWQTTSVQTPEGKEIYITATPARHGPAGTEKLQGDVIGFLLDIKEDAGPSIYITGDTVFYEGVAEVAKLYRPKYVFIFAGAAQPRGPFNVTMRTNDAIDTALAFPDATIIPLHFEGWAHLTQNAEDIRISYDMLGLGSRLKLLEGGVATLLED
jgi:L-ascorbate metabolism protein UlaG (beta-lactamase superfamily)